MRGSLAEPRGAQTIAIAQKSRFLHRAEEQPLSVCRSRVRISACQPTRSSDWRDHKRRLRVDLAGSIRAQWATAIGGELPAATLCPGVRAGLQNLLAEGLDIGARENK